MSGPRPTTTSYVVLGLLSLRPWSAYELAQQADRTLRWVLPRAERAVYLEVKRLQEMDWALAEERATGKRTRQVYRITDAGRAALRAWMEDTEKVTTTVYSDVLLRIFLAEQTPPGALAAAIEAVGSRAQGHLGRMAEMADGPSPVPDRLPTNMLALSFLAEVHDAIRRWSESAQEALAVIETGDQEAIDAQTEAMVARIRSLA